MNNLEKEASQYLKTKKEYKKIMEAFKEKYKKTGKLTGKIKLNNISKEESLILGSIDYSLFGVSEGSLSVKKFIDFFSQGKFEGIDFIQVLKEYFGEKGIQRHHLFIIGYDDQIFKIIGRPNSGRSVLRI